MEKLEFKGSKGKWHSCCKDATPHYLFAGDGETVICAYTIKQDLRDDMPLEEMQANARLIEASKDLLEALQNVLLLFEDSYSPTFNEDILKAKQAIEKALK